MVESFPVPPGKPEFGPSGKRIIYDKDGKPCKTCNTLLDFRMASGKKTTPSSVPFAAAAGLATTVSTNTKKENDGYKDCPPDSELLGKSTWTLLHSIAATYPEKPTAPEQENLQTFIRSFSKLYPCWFCAEDFREYIKNEKPKVTNRDEFGKWLCDAHNAVNVKIGKPKFDCNLWKERWKDGWKDGRCD